MLWMLLSVFFASAMLVSLRFVHMLQLSSYQTPGYRKWLRENGADVYRAMAPLAVGALLAAIFENEYMAIAAAASMLLALVLQPRKKAKKPLVFTGRVVRLLAAHALLLAALCIAAYFLWLAPFLWLGPRVPIALLCLSMFASAQILMVANWITMPLQKLINGFYLRDAQNKLAAVPNLLVIGVTGSYGKTSAKVFLHKLLSSRYNVLMTPESYNTPMGVVRAIREGLEPSHQLFVCEMGARHVGDIAELCRIVRPSHGLITSIGPQHLETFGSLENIINTKFELIDALPPEGIAFLADGNEHIHQRPISRRTVRYALRDDTGLDYRVTDISADRRGSRFTVTTRDGESREFLTPVLGRHQVENIAGAIAVAHTLGISLAKLALPVMGLENPPHRLRLIRGGGLTVIDDAFNANPAGARAALDTLAMFSGAKILVTPGMVELGERQNELNREFGRDAASVCDYVALVGVKQTLPIAEGLLEEGYPEARWRAFDTLGQAMDWVRGLDAEDKVVLLENDLPDNY